MRRTFRVLLVVLTVLSVSGIGPMALEHACVQACHGDRAAAAAGDGCCDEGPAPDDQCDCCTHVHSILAQLDVPTPAPPTLLERHFGAPLPQAPAAPPAEILHVPLQVDARLSA